MEERKSAAPLSAGSLAVAEGCRCSGKAGRAHNPSERADTLEQCGPSVLTPAPSLLIKIVLSYCCNSFPTCLLTFKINFL